MKKLLIFVLALCAQLSMAQGIEKMNVTTVPKPAAWTTQTAGAAFGSIKIGYLEFGNLVYDAQYQLYRRFYFFTIYPPTITANWLSFSDLIFTVNGVTFHWGPFTCPTTDDGQGCGGVFAASYPTTGVPPDATCGAGCTAVTMQLVSPSGGFWSVPLASGQMYPVWGINTSTIVPLQGQRFIKDHQRLALTLYLDAAHK